MDRVSEELKDRILIKRHKTDLDINSNTDKKKKVHKANQIEARYPILSRVWPVSTSLYM